MTLLEKVLGTKEASEEAKEAIVDSYCPSDFKSTEHIPEPTKCYSTEVKCRECWNREYVEL